MRKVKLNPTTAQKALLRKFAHAARFSYNEAVARVNRGDKVNKMELRNAIVTHKGNAFFDDKAWLLETPKVVRQQAVFEATKNFKTCFTNQRNGHIQRFKMSFRSRRTRSWTLGIEKQLKSVGGVLTVLPKTLGQMRYYGKLPFDGVPDGECTMHRNACGDVFLCVPVRVVVPQQGPPGGVAVSDKPLVSVDPGVRKFLTCYSPSGEAFALGTEFRARALKLLQHIDRTNEQVAALAKRRRGDEAIRRTIRYLRNKKRRLYEDYRHLRDELHWQSANFLTARHSAIVSGKLEPQRMASRLRTKTNRTMFAQSHGMFIERLRHKCLERQVPLLVVEEHYTSKTCGACGQCVDVGASEVYRCTACGYVVDRDVNAARNILLKHVVMAWPTFFARVTSMRKL